MLVTRQNKIPFIWVVMTMLPWAFWYFQMTMGTVSFFILNRLIENPAALTFWTSLPGLIFTFLPLGAFISFKSDRIWTRWGRRKPFIIIGFTGWAAVLACYPLAPDVWIFVGLMYIFALMGQFNAPLEALKLETIPPPMRGRSAALWSWITTVLNITFWMIVIGRMDEVVSFEGTHISGDKVLYWAASACLLIALFIYLFGIHEVDPKSTLTGEKFSVKKLIKALTMKELRYLYLLLFATSMLNAGLGSLGMLMYTEQWSYSNQEMGFNIAVGGVINLFLIPLVGIFADKGNRMKIYLGCLGAILLLKIAYFGYVTWYLPDQRPSLVEIIFFGEITCVFGIVAGVVYFPLVYDYIPRNLMGTYFAGAGILNGIIGFVTLNGAGTFLLWWANMFQPPSGEMVRICVDKETDRTHIEETLRQANLKTPDGTPAKAGDIVARAWYGDGVVNERGTCFEIRLHDQFAKDNLDKRKEIEGEVSTLDGKVKLARSRGASAESLAAREQELESKRAEVKRITDMLNARSDAWRDEVVRGLGAEVFDPGNEILGATTGQAVIAVLPVTRKPKDVEVERLNRQLRLADPQAIGMRVIRRDRGFALSIGSVLPAGGDAPAVIGKLVQHIAEMAKQGAPGLIAQAPEAGAVDVTVRPLTSVEIALVEVPVRSFVSLITRGVNGILSVFTEVPPPDQKLHSLARSLSIEPDGGVALARVDALPQEGKGLRVSVVSEAESIADATAWQGKIRDLVRKKGADVKYTVPVPVQGKDVVPIKYNYLAGYLWMIALTMFGFGLILYFIRQEKRGKIRKLGAEEAHAENTANAKRDADEAAAKAEAKASGVTDENRAPTRTIETYTPGYLWPKLLMAVVGLVIMILALREVLPDLKLLVSGVRSEAVAVAVVAQKPGQPDERFTTQTELKAKTETVKKSKDYAWEFWNEFAFDLTDGKEQLFRRDVGCKLQPSMPLLDDSGLPTTALVLYDAKNPTRCCLPLEYSTWFAPFIFFMIGLAACCVGVILAWFARKPIPLSGDAAVNPTGGDTTRISMPTGGKH